MISNLTLNRKVICNIVFWPLWVFDVDVSVDRYTECYVWLSLEYPSSYTLENDCHQEI